MKRTSSRRPSNSLLSHQFALKNLIADESFSNDISSRIDFSLLVFFSSRLSDSFKTPPTKNNGAYKCQETLSIAPFPYLLTKTV